MQISDMDVGSYSRYPVRYCSLTGPVALFEALFSAIVQPYIGMCIVALWLPPIICAMDGATLPSDYSL
jgi:hypothetical protein